MSLGSFLTALIVPQAIERGWLPESLPEELRDQGFIGFRDLEDGNILAVLPLTFGRARLTWGAGPKKVMRYDWDPDGRHEVPIGYDGGCDKVWDFDSIELAIDAMQRFPDFVKEIPE